ncbi:flagellar biosynthesis protein FlhB [Legionella waltersii]|uniref:Flagellar biosynthetic protein FlhB n=1 Tax=Legionella waltersii TaxID=66969 RepID=A0A0W1AAI6_9GAMM|nr:flagellar biosynthesis protein FlhB [Legionella waltersii]KTD78382.1 flagellar biosynthetic protein FlhB [Legionella waltersii]SNV06340.1 flagellar biosynthetic protein FlhB [Legionella waltersii]
MADDDNSQEKTEQPSEKRLKESREKGQVARSKDFNATVILLMTTLGLFIFGKQLSIQLASMMKWSFEFDRLVLLTPTMAFERLFFLATKGFLALVPFLVLVFIVSLLAPLLVGGWIFSGQSLQPKFSRLNPLKGFKRMVSVKGFVEMIKAFLKFALVAGVSIVVLRMQIPQLLSLGGASIETAVASGALILLKSFLFICSSLILIAVIDVPFQLYEHSKSIKMTKQELKDEYKETEGKPEVKSAIRRAQHEVAKRRMMSEVPKADVILTNPTHYAVAISYKKNGKRAPVVLAKGKNLVAFQISKVASTHKIPIISVPPLARAVYFSTKINAEIPRGLYVAVAQVLAYIFQLRDKQRYDAKPEILQNVPIPPDLMREAEEDEE